MRVSDIQPGKKKGQAGGSTAAQIHAHKKLAGPESLITLLLTDALHQNTSDIHILNTSVHYRIGTVLRPAQPLPSKQLTACVTMIKQQAALDDTQLVAQIGHFQAKSGQKTIDVRVTVMPTLEGEKLVLHLAHHDDTPVALRSLGFWGKNEMRTKQAITPLRGLVVISGLVGPYTTRTAMSMLHPLTQQGSTVASLEDPIEESIPNVLQTQVNHRSGISFESGLRTFLHQDTDAVFISDLRDRATAQLALQAALSRQLIIAACYSPSASSTIAYLLSMNLEPFLLAAALTTIISQRQIRLLCEKCKLAYKPSQQEIGIIFHTFGITTRERLDQLYELEGEAGKAGIGASIGNNGHVKGSLIARLYKADPKGCSTCHHTGYTGTTLLAEVLELDQTVRSLITHHSTADAIQTHAMQTGMIPLQLDGLVKALRGIVSIEEIIRTIKI